MRWMFGLAVLASGCVTVDSTFSDTLSSDGVFVFRGSSDRGIVAYDGRGMGRDFDISGRSWATGSGSNRAGEREASNRYGVEVEGEALVASAVSFDTRSGVDFDVFGPEVMDIEIVTEHGEAELFDVTGTHVVTARRIIGDNISGDVDFFADGRGLDVEVYPHDDGTVSIRSRGGNATIYLPRRLNYDLNIIGDPNRELELEDLGFDRMVVDPGLAIAWRGDRSVRVDIEVTGGDVRVLSAR